MEKKGGGFSDRISSPTNLQDIRKEEARMQSYWESVTGDFDAKDVRAAEIRGYSNLRDHAAAAGLSEKVSRLNETIEFLERTQKSQE